MGHGDGRGHFIFQNQTQAQVLFVDIASAGDIELPFAVLLEFHIGGVKGRHFQHAHLIAAVAGTGHAVQVAYHVAIACAAVELNGLIRGSIVKEVALVQEQAAIAQLGNCAHVVADVEHRAAAAGNVGHLVQAFLLESQVANGQNLVTDQDIRRQVCRHGKAELDKHAGGIALDGGINEAVNLGEFHDLVHLFGNFCAAHAQDCAVEVYVFAAGELRMEASTHFQQARDAAMDADFALGGRSDAGNQLEHGGFARAVAAAQGQSVAPIHRKADIIQGLENFAIMGGIGADFAVRVFLAHLTGNPTIDVAIEQAAADHAQAILFGNVINFQQSFSHN